MLALLVFRPVEAHRIPMRGGYLRAAMKIRSETKDRRNTGKKMGLEKRPWRSARIGKPLQVNAARPQPDGLAFARLEFGHRRAHLNRLARRQAVDATRLRPLIAFDLDADRRFSVVGDIEQRVTALCWELDRGGRNLERGGKSRRGGKCECARGQSNCGCLRHVGFPQYVTVAVIVSCTCPAARLVWPEGIRPYTVST